MYLTGSIKSTAAAAGIVPVPDWVCILSNPLSICMAVIFRFVPPVRVRNLPLRSPLRKRQTAMNEAKKQKHKTIPVQRRRDSPVPVFYMCHKKDTKILFSMETMGDNMQKNTGSQKLNIRDNELSYRCGRIQTT